MKKDTKDRRYEVLRCGQVEKLIKKRDHVEEPPLYYVPIEEMFDIVRSSHIATGHVGRDRMLKEVKKKYANISVQTIELFKSLFTQCQKKRVRPKTSGGVVRPILTKDFACRALFGNEARVGLTTSSLPREILDNLESEHDLARLDLASAESPAPSTDTGLTSVEPTPLASSLDEPPLMPSLRMNQPLLPPLRLNPPLLLPLRLKLVPLQLTLPLIHLNQLLLLRQKLTTI
ncbi:hypothetical protein Pcinc_005592 [Petrolisthes cinctipes]|uniref:Integrase zinc-binding domain-containing protein n=1 Tax=Petrolisthes cinctipes TaxID=88211 RepID=A0AAE1GJ24_PETCI|nr:hypothetical protein Pcinc_005592 [Petrolisthes cinctipes]